MANRWLLTDYHHGWINGDFYVQTATDVPCHMSLRLTHKEKRIHLRSEEDRGLKKLANPKYCFVEYAEIEQTEDGDTYDHGFVIPDLPLEEPIYYNFEATKDGEKTPSNTGILDITPPAQGNAKELEYWKPPFFYNAHFDIWPDPDSNPFHWDRIAFGTGFGAWIREERTFYSPPYCVLLKPGGYAFGQGFIQVQSAIPFRGRSFIFGCWAMGYIYPNNDIYVGASGPHPVSGYDTVKDHFNFGRLEVPLSIPDDAEEITIRVRAYSPDYGPISTWFDSVFIYRT